MELITILEAARRVPSHRSRSKHVDVNVIRRWVQRGRLTRYRVAGVLHVNAYEVKAIVAKRDVSVPVKRKSRHFLVERALSHFLATDTGQHQF